ncbi:ABC transporter substrate-binding protein [Nocardioides endophyticus]|uniref:ABC transporter substrate-binding protein n=1 Tax=Nocardioides endophyticus TaxID=1353775 RepID=A0ABP8YHA9_9ACTN
MNNLSRRSRIGAAAIAAGLLTTSLTACSGASAHDDAIRVGYFPNLAHAGAILGVEGGYFADHLGDVDLTTEVITAGPDAVTALVSDKVDMAFLGPAPAVNAYLKSDGDVTLISGASSGGVRFVARPELVESGDFSGAKIASPALGGSPDVALRYWLGDEGYAVDVPDAENGVSVVPQEPGQSVGAYASGAIDGAWMHEPFVSLLEDAGAEEVVDERDLWPGGQFATTVLVVRTSVLEERRDDVEAVLAGLVDAMDAIDSDPSGSRAIVASFIAGQTGLELDPALVGKAWSSIDFTTDPLEDTIESGARRAVVQGVLDSADLDGFVDLGPLTEVGGSE